MHTTLSYTALILLSAAFTVTSAVPAGAQGKKKKNVNIGYTNTPVIPGQKWRVHDANRPRPKIIQAGTASTPSTAGKAPSDAIVLFDGSNLDAWTGKGGKAAHWKVENGYAQVERGGPIRTKEKFGSCQLHIEWQTPNPPKGDCQGRSDSGIDLMNSYEIQILDSFHNVTYADGQAGALYGQQPPLVNASRKPGAWQSYDILFTAPTFKADGTVQTPAIVTVLHNGVVLHNHQAMLGSTTHKKVAKYRAHSATDHFQLQDHGNPVRFRNIWIRPLANKSKKRP